MHDLALPVFTLFVQSAIGLTFALLVLYRYQLMPVGKTITPFNLKSIFTNKETLILFVMCGLTSLGLLASMTHLGYLPNAMYSISHFQSSWLSREIILSSAFLSMIGFAFLSQWARGTFPITLLIIAALLGICDVYSMASIYKAASVVTWDFAHTYTSFFGMLVTCTCLGLIWGGTKKPKMQQLALLILVISLLGRAFSQVDLLINLPEKVQQLGLLFPSQAQVAFYEHLNWLAFTWATGAISLIVIIYSVLTKPASYSKLLITGTSLMVVYEACGRYLFYAIS